jgi:threonine efflux protein
MNESYEMDASTLLLILGAALIASASPGPATLALAGTTMARGRAEGLSLAAGITCGSLIWSVTAAVGLGALMFTHVWVVETMRYLGAAYLMFLAYRSARAALIAGAPTPMPVAARSLRRTFATGLLLHLTNPKAILFFGSLYAVGLPADATPETLAIVIAAVGLQSFVIFHGYALVFSVGALTRAYLKARRALEALFAVCFGGASVSIAAARLD